MLNINPTKLTAIECLLKCADVAGSAVSQRADDAETGQELYETVMNGALQSLLDLGVTMEEFTVAGLRLLAQDNE